MVYNCFVNKMTTQTKMSLGGKMFKSTFAKYLTAFILVLMISFVILSGIVTTTIRSHVSREREAELVRSSTAISKFISDQNVDNLENNLWVGASIIKPLIDVENNINLIIVDKSGSILLRTVVNETTGNREIKIGGKDMGSVDLIEFVPKRDSVAGDYKYFSGVLTSLEDYRVSACAQSITSKGATSGYVISYLSLASEDALVAAARASMIQNALWIMLAAVVAIYFLTDRIIHPLKSMTNAAKSFARGDFSTRVTVYGNDEVSELAEAFNNMAESLDSFEKMRNSFLANVSHDLRTPMTTIAGFIDGINSGAIPPEKHEYYLGVISNEVHRLSRLVTDLLDISRLESGERKFNFERFDIAEMARIILISFEKKIDEKNLDVIFEADEDEIAVIADKDAIHQVLYNLCHNAIKFAKDGGKFAISITKDINKKVRVSVYDEGMGISGEDLTLVFDRFYKTDKSRGLDKNGVGLGLYICKTIIDAHGERIHAESPNENGAEFWFTLPLADPKKK